jgi:hypothetical protein
MMMAKDVSQRYQNASDLIEDLDAVSSGNAPQYAQPTLDFAKLAEVAKATSSSEPIPQTRREHSSDFSSIWLPMLIVSVVINIILIVVLMVS